MQAIGEIPVIYVGQKWIVAQIQSPAKSNATNCRPPHYLPRKGNSCLLIAANCQLIPREFHVRKFPSTEKTEWERCWINHCNNNLFWLSAWHSSFTLAAWNVSALSTPKPAYADQSSTGFWRTRTVGADVSKNQLRKGSYAKYCVRFSFRWACLSEQSLPARLGSRAIAKPENLPRVVNNYFVRVFFIHKNTLQASCSH